MDKLILTELWLRTRTMVRVHDESRDAINVARRQTVDLFAAGEVTAAAYLHRQHGWIDRIPLSGADEGNTLWIT